MLRLPLFSAALCLPLLTACSTTKGGEEVETVAPSEEEAEAEPEIVTEVRTVERPCRAAVPKRPDPLPDTLPSHPVALAALLGAKLAEYSAPGKYADQADAYFKACPPNR